MITLGAFINRFLGSQTLSFFIDPALDLNSFFFAGDMFLLKFLLKFGFFP